MRTFTSSQIGLLLQNDQIDDFWDSEPVKIPLFDNIELEVTFVGFTPENDPGFIQEADEALKNLLSLKSDLKFRYSDLVYQYCRDCISFVGQDASNKHLWEINDSNEVWQYVDARGVIVSRRNRRDKDIYVSIVCGCEWEPEHGLQIVLRQGKQVTRISDQDGHLTSSDAYDTPDAEDVLLSKFSE